ncbi:Carbon-nitrogen hydrolase - like 10 [Theobroma cacao]|nr:Carbon-nitrogen hydrolase - like 10 [Theobroma cacao]
MKTAVSSLFNSKNLSHSAISRSLLQHSSKPFSQRAFFVPTIPRNTKNLYNQLYQKLQIRTKSTSVMASSFKPEQARAPPSLRLLSQKSVALYLNAVGGDKLYNSCCVFGTDGKLKPKHRKIHLFDIDISGKITFMEPKTLIAGETTTIVDTGAHLLCYPGAFNMTTGPCIGSCCTEQDAGAGYMAWGRSTLIGPFGEVLATFEHDENIIIAEIAYSILEQRRASLPSAKQR